MDYSILESGLSIISQCKERTGDIWEAHFGAAAIASYFFVKENALSAKAVARITEESHAMLRSRTYVHIPRNAEETDVQAEEMAILIALEPTMDGLHWVGHNVIYAALSLWAIKELGHWGRKDDIAGISKLIESFHKTIPGRSWLGYSVSEVKKLEVEEGDCFPEIRNAEQLSDFILNELSSFRTIYKAEAHHDLIGHMLTFSQALNILHDLGHTELFLKGIPSLLKLIKALRMSRDIDPKHPPKLLSPVDRLPLQLAYRSEWLPVEDEYWLRDFQHLGWEFGHTFKFPYSLYNHMNRLPRPNSKAVENFRYIIG
ncbi:hypothetical protein M6D81_24890 [Paenibacillus sp. J5C_2022]|uniref:hypothetical protein n=1 Tax=Paenibacillus sp. J5C2022 TaxID=2977129 RepID=UPI0021D07232|nr:hypothetical protein [Paenibacillus sp. J5C2022]MCU6711944.1 hypothetical protein [Paenibacillus sp. J5C2022]